MKTKVQAKGTDNLNNTKSVEGVPPPGSVVAPVPAPVLIPAVCPSPDQANQLGQENVLPDVSYIDRVRLK